MSLDGTWVLVSSFALGVASSLAASWILIQRSRAPLRLHFRSVLKLIERLAIRIRERGFSPDHVVAIDRSSGVVGSILCGFMGPQAIVSVNLIHARTETGARSTTIDELSKSVLQLLGGKRLLLVIACNGTGTSLAAVVGYLQTLDEDCRPGEIRTAALYTTASPVLTPNYAGLVIDDDTKLSMNVIVSRLPWMTSRWMHSLGTERLRRRTTDA